MPVPRPPYPTPTALRPRHARRSRRGALLGASLLLALALSALGASSLLPLAHPEAAAQADWLGTSLADVRSEQTFTLRGFEGRVVLLQPMAVW